MKKYILIIISIFALFSCRNDIITKSTPEEVFLAFWKTLDENYVYFEEKNLDWDSIYHIYYPQAQAAKDRYALYGIFSEIIPLFKDGHVSMHGYLSSDYYFSINYSFMQYVDTLNWYRHNTNDILKEWGFEEKKYSQNFRCYQHKNKNYAMISTYAMGAPIGTEQKTMLGELTSVINSLNCKDGLIFDITNNGGGFVNEILPLFFADEKMLYYAQFKTGKGHNDFSDKIPQTVQGEGVVPETVPVVVLTGPNTFSAANCFAYIVKDFPNVTILGKKTGGGGGPIHLLTLPNSWIIASPFAKAFGINGENMEFPLVPDIYVKKVNSNNEDVTNESDVIIKAIEVLDSINNK